MNASSYWSKKQIFATLFSLALLVSVSAIVFIKSAGAALTPCTFGPMIQVGNTSPGSSGIVPIYLGWGEADLKAVQTVEFYLIAPGNPFIGYGVNGGIGTDVSNGIPMPGPIKNYKTIWDTSLTIPNASLGLASGPYNVGAIVTYSDATQCEYASTTTEVINNSVITNVVSATYMDSANSTVMAKVFINSGTARGLSIKAAVVDASYANTLADITPYVKYGTWYAEPNNLGTITPGANFYNAIFVAGNAVPAGNIRTNMQYAGRTWLGSLPVSITLPSSGTATTTTTNTTNNPATSTTLTTNPTTTAPTTVSPATTTTTADQTCIISVIGKDRFAQISKGFSQPTADETLKLRICYEQRNNIIPTAFAPVKPDDIKKVTLSSQATLAIKDLNNQEIKSGNTSNKVLVIKGKSRPNQTVFLYIFSVPLVVTTQADKDGNWVYVLKDPITPGKHEVYAVVNRGDGSYEKSSPFSFLIGKAQATPSNPNGLSLELQVEPTPAPNNRTLYVYIAGVVILVTIALIVLLFFIKKKFNKKLAVEQVAEPSLIMPNVNNNPVV